MSVLVVMVPLLGILLYDAGYRDKIPGTPLPHALPSFPGMKLFMTGLVCVTAC